MKAVHELEATSDKESRVKEFGFRKLTLQLLLIWTTVLVLSLIWSFSYIKTSTYNMAQNALEMNIKQDLVFRSWAAGHGGVYVIPTEQTPPNQNLAHLEERDVTTTTGKQLTLINPAYIMRQVHEMAEDHLGVNGRLVSLNPIVSHNEADPWEREALQSFETGSEEALQMADLDGEYVMRLIRPFYTEGECLGCHDLQGFEPGEVYGGISVAIPLAPYQANIHTLQLYLTLVHGLIWVLGFGGILWMVGGVAASTEQWHRSEEKYRTIVNNTNDALFIHDFKGTIIDLNDHATRMLGYSREELVGANVAKITSDEDIREIPSRMVEIMETGSLIFEVSMLRKDGTCVPGENSSKLVTYDGNGVIQGFVRDITERKNTEDKILRSQYDQLTGLYNRGHLEVELTRLDAKEYVPVSTIMVDLNGLKLINDTYGHIKGDEMLLCAAEVVLKSCRDRDIVARYGGDEFVVLLPNTKKEEAEKICNSIKEECKTTYIGDVPLTMALGVESKVRHEDSIYAVLQIAEENMYRNKLRTSRSDRSAVLNALLKTLSRKSEESEEHCNRMQKMALKMGCELGLSQIEMERLSLAVYLHDIGKITIPEAILKKSGKMTQKEWEAVREHPVTGYRIARSTEKFSHVAGEILAHHERWDGSGYPDGLVGEDIPLLARIISIVDAYDVMTHGRLYKKAREHDEVIKEIKNNAGSQFDPELTVIFLSLFLEN